jgi:Pre ATP-grasp domain/Carbamoyl-phosphate synthase L chain, ATP binding domain
MSESIVHPIAKPAAAFFHTQPQMNASAAGYGTGAVPRATEGITDMFRALLPESAAPDARLIWISNFEAERFWTHPETLHLPAVSQVSDVAIVNRLEEMTLFLAESPDMVILRQASDPDFIDYIASLELKPAQVLSSEATDTSSPITQTVLQNAELCDELVGRARRDGEFYLLPYATSHLEEEMAGRTAVPGLGASAAVCQKVNSKIYSRRTSRELRLNTVPGGECESIKDIEAAYQELSKTSSVLVIKESMGVSGRGLSLIDSATKMRSLLAMLKRRWKPDSRVEFVFESWIDKAQDINYQIFIAPSGEVRLLSIKEAVTKNGVHMGHHWPPALTPEQYECYRKAAEAIGYRLYMDGFTGIAGIDSIIDREGTVYPVLEINARFNMSTYELRLDEIIAPEMEKVVKYYPLALSQPLNFLDLSSALGSDMFHAGSQSGIGVFCFATANCNFRPDAALPAKGRLYVFIAGRDAAHIDHLDGVMLKALERCGAIKH